MYAKLKNNYCSIDDSVKSKVYQTFRVDSSDVSRDVKTLQEWIKTQPHLPQNIADDVLEKWLIKNKFKIESTKFRIEKYYTMKAFKAKDIAKISSCLPNETIQMIIPLPKLTDKLERIVIMKMKNSTVENDEDIKRGFKLSLCINEYSLYCDYSLSYRIILDFEGLTEQQVKKCVVALASIAKPYLAVYFSRVSGIEYLNTPQVLEDFFKKLKAVIPAKMYRRIGVHKDLSSLHKNVSKSYLPLEYGGTLNMSISEIMEKWNEEIKDNLEILEDIVTNEIADESKRIGERIGGLKYDQFFGTTGKFKQLSID